MSCQRCSYSIGGVATAAKYPVIDSAVFEWFCSVRALGETRKPLLISKAMLEAKRQAMTKFSGSDDWFSHWRWHFDISKCVKLHGEAGDVDLKQQNTSFKNSGLKLANILLVMYLTWTKLVYFSKQFQTIATCYKMRVTCVKLGEASNR